MSWVTPPLDGVAGWPPDRVDMPRETPPLDCVKGWPLDGVEVPPPLHGGTGWLPALEGVAPGDLTDIWRLNYFIQKSINMDGYVGV